MIQPNGTEVNVKWTGLDGEKSFQLAKCRTIGWVF